MLKKDEGIQHFMLDFIDGHLTVFDLDSHVSHFSDHRFLMTNLAILRLANELVNVTNKSQVHSLTAVREFHSYLC